MKTLVLLISVALMATTAQASTPKISIAETKRVLAEQFPNRLAGDELSDSATCEEIDLFFEKHGLLMQDVETDTIQSAKDLIDCVSSK